MSIRPAMHLMTDTRYRHTVVTTLILLATLAVPGVLRAGKGVGEFSIPSLLPLNDAALAKLRRLVATDDEAKAIAARVATEARPLIGLEPTPLRVIHYEGLVNTDPRRIATVAKLRQMGDASRLMRHWQMTGDADAAATLRRLVIAWTDTYRHTGNDVNENKFYPLLVAYLALRETFDAEDRSRVDSWVRKLGEMHAKAVRTSTHFTNRYTKHVRLLTLAGLILGRDAWVAEAHKGIKRFVSRSLYADGSSHDFKRRDTLTYHGSALKPVIDLAMIAGDSGPALYAWENADGGSIKRSVDFVVPYAMGEKTHKEWVHTKVDLDRRRAKAGLEKYRPGRLYEPKHALELMEKASRFDPSLMRVVLHLSESDAERYPTWQTLINDAARAE